LNAKQIINASFGGDTPKMDSPIFQIQQKLADFLSL